MFVMALSVTITNIETPLCKNTNCCCLHKFVYCRHLQLHCSVRFISSFGNTARNSRQQLILQDVSTNVAQSSLFMTSSHCHKAAPGCSCATDSTVTNTHRSSLHDPSCRLATVDAATTYRPEVTSATGRPKYRPGITHPQPNPHTKHAANIQRGFWNMTPCRSSGRRKCFGETFCFHLQ
jgi:hypothetical protein